MIVLVVSCFQARFEVNQIWGQPDDSEKGGTYMGNIFEAMRERERGGAMVRERQIGKWSVGLRNPGHDSNRHPS